MSVPGRTAHLVGVDVGGTKTHLAYVDGSADTGGSGGGRHDIVVASSDWRHGPLFGDERNLERLGSWIAEMTPLHSGSRVAIGLRDCDSEDQLALARVELSSALDVPVLVLNDADLLGPAAGLTECITMVVGTGAIVSGRDHEGRRITSDGHGWLFGDWGSGPALVRDAIGRLLDADDRGADTDPLAPLMLEHFGDPDISTLGSHLTVSADPAYWTTAAPLIFKAASCGSGIASSTIAHAAERLSSGVAGVRARGARGEVVVAAGGVIAHQRMLEAAIRGALRRVAPGIRLIVLDAAPVEGALRLAARITISSDANVVDHASAKNTAPSFAGFIIQNR